MVLPAPGRRPRRASDQATSAADLVELLLVLDLEGARAFLQVLEAAPGLTVDLVLDGEADFGVAASELALHRAQGNPVVALAAIVQHSPLILLVNRRKVSVIDSLQGSRIMLTPHETELFAYLRREEVT